MRIFFLQILAAITSTAGIGGALAVLIGGGSCLGGLAAVGTIELGKWLEHSRPTYQKMIVYGSASVGSGLFLIGAALGMATIGEKLALEELKLIQNEIENERSRQASQQPQVVNIRISIPEPTLPDEIEDEIEEKTDQYPACVRCKHFHGEEYGGNFLVCGMHPYGWDDENCPDWEKK